VSVPCAHLVTMEISFVEGFFLPSEHTGNPVLNSVYRHKEESPSRVVMLVLMQPQEGITCLFSRAV